MDEIPCVHCGKFFIPRNRKQNYCTETDCQRARKAAWQRYKMKTDAEYRTQQKLSNEKWVNNTPVTGADIDSVMLFWINSVGFF